MAMADEDRLKLLLQAHTSKLTDDLIDEVILKGDNKVTRYINKNIANFTTPTPTPSQFIDAATLYAAQSSLDIFGTDGDKRSPTAIQWEKEAIEALDEYITAYTSDNDVSGRGVEIGISVIYNPDQMEEDEEESEE